MRLSLFIVWYAGFSCLGWASSGNRASVRGDGCGGDTVAPRIPDDLNLPQTYLNIVSPPGEPNVAYYRNVAVVAFDDTVCASTVRAFLARHHATVIGGAPSVGPRGAYVIRLAQAAPSFEALDSLISRIEAEPGVAEAAWVTYRDLVMVRSRAWTRRGWPVLTDRLPNLDTSRVSTQGDSFRIYRTDIGLSFKPDVSDSAKAAFFERHAMTVIGVTLSEHFFVRIADPGPTAQAFRRVLEALRREPEVALAAFIPRDPLQSR